MCADLLSADLVPASLRPYSFDDRYRVPLLSAAPTLDGQVEEMEWRCAAAIDGLSYPEVLEERRAMVRVGATRTHLYVAIVSEMPDDGLLVSHVTANTNSLIWDDSVEVWIDPNPGEHSGVTFQFLANSTGYRAYQAFPRGQVNPDTVYGWDGNYRVAHGIHDGYWHCEVEIPLAAVAHGRTATDGCWGINVCRNFKRPWAFAALGCREYPPVDTITFTFAEDAIAIRQQHHTDPTTRTVNTTLSLYNPGDYRSR